MTQSRRARRMAKHHARAKRQGSLNLVSLMDIFTILVFFLLVHTGDAQNMPSSEMVALPESMSESKPRQTVTVTVTEQDLLVGGRAVASLASLPEGSLIIEPLRRALDAEAGQALSASEDAQDRGEVTILGNKTIPFALLKQVMATCTAAGFGRISLAVEQKENEGS
jgi:biopolymer transport protein TolR